MLGNGAGLFTYTDTSTMTPTTPLGVPYGIITADFNGDLHQDFALVKRISSVYSNMRVMLGDGTGQFSIYADLMTNTNNPTDIVSGDFDGNGSIDIVTMSAASPGTLSFFANNGSGFNAAINTTPGSFGLAYYARAGYFDNDANLDVLITLDGAPGKLVFMHGNGDGTFTTGLNMTIGSNPRDLDLADFNGDTKMDVAVALSGTDSVVVVFGDGLGGVSSVATYLSGGDGPLSLKVADIDGDTDNDIVVGNLFDYVIGVLKNDGSGNFTLNRHEGFTDIQELTIGNFDGDANPDIVFTSSGTKKLMYMGNDGAGGFISYNNLFDPDNITRPNSAAGLDFNGDGFTDVVAANSTTNTFSFFTGDGAGNYTFNSSIATATGPISIQAGDFDGDTKNDVLLLESSVPQLTYYPGNGAGVFGAPVSVALSGTPVYVLTYDLDNDTDLDAVVVNAAGSVDVYVNNSGTFSLVANNTTGINGPSWVAAGLIDGDNIPDLAVCNNTGNNVKIFIGAGSCNFTAGNSITVSSGPDVVAVGDINGDTYLDIAVCYGTTSQVSYAYGDGSGTFGSVTNLSVSGASSITGIVMADMNLDGNSDVVTCNNGTHDVSVLKGSGSGLTYQGAFFSGYRPVYISTGSINGDMLPDLFVCNADATNGASSVAAIINRTAYITISGSASVCNGSSVPLTGTASYAYNWSSGETTQSINANTTNSYTLTTTNYNTGCTSVSTPVSVTINPSPAVTSVSGNTTICSSSSTTLTANTDATTPQIVWYDQLSGGSILQSGAAFTTPTLISNTSYYIEVTDLATGCVLSPRYQVDVQIGDVTAPTFTSCPATITVNSDPGSCGAIVTWTAPIATDNCGTPTVSQSQGLPSGSTFPVGTNTVEFTAIDAASNTSTCTFQVIVTDVEAPVFISCPSNITVGNSAGTCGATVTWSVPAATDNCGSPTVTLTSGQAPGSVFSTGTTAIVYTASDANGNTNTCSFTVTVNDTENPVIAGCPSTQNLNNAAGTCGQVASWVPPTVSDNCGGATITQTSGLASGSTFPVGTNTIVYTATDGNGNTSTCSFDIVVSDTELPVFNSCTPAFTINNNTGVCGRVITFPMPGATDNCSGVTVTQVSGLTSGSTFPIGNSTVVFEATDASGNIATCSQTVTIVDAEFPQIVGMPSNISVSASSGSCDAVANWAPPTVTDNCSGATITQSAGLPSGSTFPAGTTIITYDATDAAGNITSASFNVTVTDATPPVISNCPSNMTVCEGDTVNFTAPTATDNCSATVTVAQISGPASGTVFPSGTSTVIFRATDGSGNFTNCTFTVSVNSVPVVNLNYPITSTCENSTLLTLNGGTPGGGVYSGNGVSGGTFDPSASGTGMQYITYTVTNSNGCSADAIDSIFVNSMPSVSLSLNDTLVCTYNSQFPLAGGSPSGGTYTGTGVSSGLFTPSTAGIGSHTITYSYTDANSCTNTVTDVIDVSSCVGVEEITSQHFIKVFPNPGNGELWLELTGYAGGNVQVDVFNLLGEKVYAQVHDGSNIRLDLSYLVVGTYILTVYDNERHDMRKIIIQK